MTDLFDVAQQLQDFCDRQGWRSCFIGGIAVQRWGEPRVTRDADLTLLAGFGREDSFIGALFDAYPALIQDSRGLRGRNRVVLLQTSGGVQIDISGKSLCWSALYRRTTSSSSRNHRRY